MDYEKRLSSRGYRLTWQRRAVYEALSSSEGPITAEELYHAAIRKGLGVGLTTVYRTLEIFKELEIASEVHLHENFRFYEMNKGDCHHHLVCVSCGEIEKLHKCMIDEIRDSLKDESDFLITSHCLSLFGYCGPCRPEKRQMEKV